MKSTDELTHEIRNAADILEYLKENRQEMMLQSLPESLEAWLKNKGLTRADVVRRSNLNKAYVYQIFSGKNIPRATRFSPSLSAWGWMLRRRRRSSSKQASAILIPFLSGLPHCVH